MLCGQRARSVLDIRRSMVNSGGSSLYGALMALTAGSDLLLAVGKGLSRLD